MDGRKILNCYGRIENVRASTRILALFVAWYLLAPTTAEGQSIGDLQRQIDALNTKMQDLQ